MQRHASMSRSRRSVSESRSCRNIGGGEARDFKAQLNEKLFDRLPRAVAPAAPAGESWGRVDL